MVPRKANSDLKLPLGSGVQMLRSDTAGLMALDKPAGLLSHPNSPGDRNRSLLAADYSEAEEAYLLPAGTEGGERKRVWLLNRLDSATSGVILVATDERIANVVRRLFETRQVQKTYLALVFGHLRSNRQVWTDQMSVKRSAGTVRAGGRGGLTAETHVRRVRQLPGPPALTLLELTPKTGRTHQLRHQCSKRRLPIVGDANYGDFRLNREFAKRSGSKRLFLHSHTIVLRYELDGHAVTFRAEAPPPREFGL